MPTWPTSLPQRADWNSYKETTKSGTIRSQPDVGPFKARPRVTLAPDAFEVMVSHLTSTQCETLMSFFKNTCAMGSTPFDWVHPRTGNPAVLVFNGDITLQGQARNKFGASFEVLILP